MIGFLAKVASAQLEKLIKQTTPAMVQKAMLETHAKWSAKQGDILFDNCPWVTVAQSGASFWLKAWPNETDLVVVFTFTDTTYDLASLKQRALDNGAQKLCDIDDTISFTQMIKRFRES